MNWEILIFPLIALGVWILSTIFRGVEEQREKNRPPRPREEGASVKVPRRPVSELDRFLDEARRRREAAQQRQQQTAPVLVEPIPEAIPLPRPAPKPAPAPAPASPLPRKIERPALQPTEPPRRAPEPAPAVPVVQTLAQSQASTHSPVPGTTVQARKLSPVLARLMPLLKDRPSLGTAFVLNEIFGRPRCEKH